MKILILIVTIKSSGLALGWQVSLGYIMLLLTASAGTLKVFGY